MKSNTSEWRYVLVTPVKNEASTISITIDSVLKQSLLPIEWVIISDGSTDNTDSIVASAAHANSWIRLIQLPPRSTRSFSAVVHATETGIQALKSTDYAYLGLLDADVRFDSDYFSRLIDRFQENPLLGLTGGMVVDLGTSKDQIPWNVWDIPGAVQLFRRNCFESLNGLLAIPEGGWDTVTCARARMNGFQTKLCTDLIVDHLKPRNVSEGGVFRRKFQLGARDYALCYSPAFEFVKCASRISESPFAIAAIARLVGFSHAAMRRKPRRLPADVVTFLHKEQVRRLRGLLSFSGFNSDQA